MRKLRIIGLVAGSTLIGVIVTLVFVSKPPALQPSVYVQSSNSPTLKGGELTRACPDIVRLDESGADYHVVGGGNQERWVAILSRNADGASIGIEASGKEELLHRVCQAVQRDFRNWLRTEQERARVSKPEPIDAPNRYALKDYRHGNIVGLALVDQQTGRVWVLTSIGERRTEFREVAVEGVWENDDLRSSQARTARTQQMTRLYESIEWVDTEIKKSTLPWKVLKARKEAEEGDPFRPKPPDFSSGQTPSKP